MANPELPAMAPTVFVDSVATLRLRHVAVALMRVRHQPSKVMWALGLAAVIGGSVGLAGVGLVWAAGRCGRRGGRACSEVPQADGC